MFRETKSLKSTISGMLVVGGFLIFILSTGMAI